MSSLTNAFGSRVSSNMSASATSLNETSNGIVRLLKDCDRWAAWNWSRSRHGEYYLTSSLAHPTDKMGVDERFRDHFVRDERVVERLGLQLIHTYGPRDRTVGEPLVSAERKLWNANWTKQLVSSAGLQRFAVKALIAVPPMSNKQNTNIFHLKPACSDGFPWSASSTDLPITAKKLEFEENIFGNK